MTKLYLDDLRVPKSDDFIVVRSFHEAVDFVQKNGIPQYVSFDHDLGCDDKGDELPSGYDFAKWLVECNLDGRFKFPYDFDFNVHSANPVDRKNIESLLCSYLAQR